MEQILNKYALSIMYVRCEDGTIQKRMSFMNEGISDAEIIISLETIAKDMRKNIEENTIIFNKK